MFYLFIYLIKLPLYIFIRKNYYDGPIKLRARQGRILSLLNSIQVHACGRVKNKRKIDTTKKLLLY